MRIQPFARALAAFFLTATATVELRAAPLVSPLTVGDLPAWQFNSLFSPMASAPVINAAYGVMNTPVTGAVLSQVFQGSGIAAGLYAYAYQIVVNPVADGNGQPTSVSSASLTFNASPVATNLLVGSGSYSAYVVKDGQIGGIPAAQAGSGGSIQSPDSITLLSGALSRSLTFQYLNAKTGSGPLEAGSRSATIVVLSTSPFTTQSVSIQNFNPQISYPIAYSPSSTAVPEPSTVLAWGGALVGLALMQRRRRSSRTA